MRRERAIELLHEIINNLVLCDKGIQLVQYLLSLGFTPEELIDEFEFGEETLNSAQSNMEDFEDTLTFV